MVLVSQKWAYGKVTCHRRFRRFQEANKGWGGAPGGRRGGATLFIITGSCMIKKSGCTHPLYVGNAGRSFH